MKLYYLLLEGFRCLEQRKLFNKIRFLMILSSISLCYFCFNTRSLLPIHINKSLNMSISMLINLILYLCFVFNLENEMYTLYFLL